MVMVTAAWVPRCRPGTGSRRALAWGLGCLWLTGAGLQAAEAANLRWLPPRRGPAGDVELNLATDDATALAPDRAGRIELLAREQLPLGSGAWLAWDGPRALTAGVLRMNLAPTGAAGFFLARDTPLPPAVTVSNATGLRAAVAAARPGSRILLAPGTYPGGFYFVNLRGEARLPIILAAVDPQNPPVIRGGGNGMQFTDPAFVELRDLVFSGATGNGLNLDDGGTFDTPARGLVLRGLRVTDVGPQGNCDGIKLSGVVGFRIDGCTLERWGTGGSAIDMVGCQAGVVESNWFRHTAAAATGGANGVQTKGGSRDVVIRRNRFEQVGARGVNVGGSTGLAFFRPPLSPGAEAWEAKDIRVEGNTFLGSTAPVAFVGVDGAVVRFNTIYRPERWALRILQENTAAGFVPCRNGVFSDNLVAFHSTQWSAGGVNVGPNTAPATFTFARNWWYCLDDPPRSRPSLPAAEVRGVYGQSPQFRDAANGDLRLQPGSPAQIVGAEALPE